MVKVAIINGMPGCGKTTFETICKKNVERESVGIFERDKFAYVQILSTVDFVKEIARECGWDGTKTPKNRKFLSDLKALLTEWDDVPAKMIENIVQREAMLGFNTIFLVDCREPAEIQKLKERLNATTVLIRRKQVENAETSNESDARVFEYNYDLTIWNNSDIIDLEKKATEFIAYMRGAPHYEYDN